MLKIIFISILLTTGSASAQFAGPAGTPGTTAMHKDSSDFIGWATVCNLALGPMDITNPGLGPVSHGDSSSAIGIPDGLVVSLGDNGSATLTFSTPITNGPGNDFAIFENSFSDSYLELAFVEVSSDGINFFRFPATSNTQADTQIGPFEASADATLLNNLAGKYRGNYGTPFDLQELSGMPGLDLQNIMHIRIIDVVGSISAPYSTFDQLGQPINDPFPTPFPSSGFDLDAIGVIHRAPAEILEQNVPVTLYVYPNPVNQGELLTIVSNESDVLFQLFTIDGNLVEHWKGAEHSLNTLTTGIYIVQVITASQSSSSKIIVK